MSKNGCLTASVIKASCWFYLLGLTALRLASAPCNPLRFREHIIYQALLKPLSATHWGGVCVCVWDDYKKPTDLKWSNLWRWHRKQSCFRLVCVLCSEAFSPWFVVYPLGPRREISMQWYFIQYCAFNSEATVWQSTFFTVSTCQCTNLRP